MPIHFSKQELADRRAVTIARLKEQGLAAALIFRQESMYYLTGYDTFGYCFFQCLVLTTDGEMILLTRAPDLRQAQQTSVIGDIRIWVDGIDANPFRELRDLVGELGLQKAALGIEFDATGLTAQRWRRLELELNGYCRLTDVSTLVSEQRLIKSEAELEHIQRAAELADDALDAAVETAQPEVFEGDILAAMQSSVFRGGGDYAGNEFIIGSGEGALLCRYFTGRRPLDPVDQLTLEFAGAYRRYHACLMRTLVIGEATDAQRKMFEACLDALLACQNALRPGQPLGDVYQAHARTFDAAGFGDARLNACGYSLGAVYAPCWMDWPMLYRGNNVLAAENMVFFLHMILMDSESKTAMTLGQTVRVSADGCEPLSRQPLEMIII